MEIEMEFTRDTLPFILTIFLAWLFTNLSKTGDSSDLSNRVKINGAIVSGVFLGIVLMFYEAASPSEVAVNYKVWVKYILMGFLIGSSAIGLNQMMKPKPTVESAQKAVVKAVKEEKKVALEEKKELDKETPKHVDLPIIKG